MGAGGPTVRLVLLGLTVVCHHAGARDSVQSLSSPESCSTSMRSFTGLAKELAASDDVEHLSLLQTRGPHAASPLVVELRQVLGQASTAIVDGALCEPARAARSSRRFAALAGSGDVELLSLLQTRGPSAVSPRVVSGEAHNQKDALGDEPFWLSAAREADGEEVARNLSQAISLVLQYSNGSVIDSHPADAADAAAQPAVARRSRVRSGNSSLVARQLADGGRRHRLRRNASLQSLEALQQQQHQRVEGDTVPWGELARAFAAMAAESTASVGEGFERVPVSLAGAGHRGDGMNLDFDVNGGLEGGLRPTSLSGDGSAGAGPRGGGRGNVSFVDLNGTELAMQDDGPDETDAILTPAALGAAVGVVVGAAVGVH